MDRVRKEWIGWFLDFINLDPEAIALERRPTEEEQQVIARAICMTQGYFFLGVEGMTDRLPEYIDGFWKSVIDPDTGVPSGVYVYDIQRVHAELRRLMETIMSRVEEAKDDDAFTPGADLFPRGLPTLLNTRTFPRKARFMVGMEAVRTGPVDDRERTIVFRMAVQPEVTEPLATDMELLVFYFIRLIEGVSFDSLRRCPECGRWFLHTSKHQRVYCENRCAARVNSRLKRERVKEQNPKKYDAELEAGAGRARKSYEKKVNPKGNLKVAKRPRKHKLS